MTQRVRLGELLVEARIITREQLGEVLAKQRSDPRRLGMLLVEAGLVTETQVTQILSQQLSIPWVSLYHIDFSRKLLNLVPRELAERACLVPIFVRRIRGLGQTLYVAMDDPSDEAAQAAVAEYSGLPVRAMIAPPSEIRAAIRAYYGNVSSPPPIMTLPPIRATAAGVPGADSALADEFPVTVRTPSSRAVPEPAALSAREPSDAPPGPDVVPAASPDEAAPASPLDRGATGQAILQGRANLVKAFTATAPEGGASASESEHAVSPRRPEIPAPKLGSGPRMITLTLLDGTQMTLPARGSSGEDATPQGDQLTARDLVEALRAAAHGADATEILGDNPRWELLMAALLSVLLKKHLVADWEFVDEYQRLSQG